VFRDSGFWCSENLLPEHLNTGIPDPEYRAFFPMRAADNDTIHLFGCIGSAEGSIKIIPTNDEGPRTNDK
jgi:hypothetical protein